MVSSSERRRVQSCLVRQHLSGMGPLWTASAIKPQVCKQFARGFCRAFLTDSNRRPPLPLREGGREGTWGRSEAVLGVFSRFRGVGCFAGLLCWFHNRSTVCRQKRDRSPTFLSLHRVGHGDAERLVGAVVACGGELVRAWGRVDPTARGVGALAVRGPERGGRAIPA